MIVQCTGCSTRFRLDESRLGSKGAKVTCSVCAHAFVVRPGDGIDEEIDLDLDGPAPAPARSPRPPEASRTLPGVMSGGSRGFSASGSTFVPQAPIGQAPGSVHEQQTAVFDTPFAQEEGAPPTPEWFDEVSTEAALPSAAPPPAPFDIDEATVAGPAAAASPEASASEAISLDTDDLISVDDSEIQAYEGTETAIDRAALEAGQSSPDFGFGMPVDSSALITDTRPALAPESAPMFTGALAADGTFTPPPTDPLPTPLVTAASPHAANESLHAPPPVAMGDSAQDVTRTAVPPPPPPEGVGRGGLVRVAVTLLLALGFTATGVYALWRTDQLDPAWIAIFQGRDLSTAEILDRRAGVAEVYPVAMRSMLYPTHNGIPLLVFTGEAKSFAAQAAPALDVVAELRDGDNIVSSQRAPLGVTLSVADLAAITGPEALAAVYASKADSAGVSAGERSPFMVAMWAPPAAVERFEHVVRLELRPAPAPPAPAPVVEPPPPVIDPPEVIEPSKAKAKGKRAKRLAPAPEQPL